MAVVLDTSVVVAFMNRRDDDHARASAWIETAEEDLVTTPLVIAEIDHLVTHGGGAAAALAFYEDLVSGAYLVEWWQEAVFEAVEAARWSREAEKWLEVRSMVSHERGYAGRVWCLARSRSRWTVLTNGLERRAL